MDLTIKGRLDAFRTQHLAGPFYYEQLLPALEKIFDELSHENEVMSLDKLELDLGIIAIAELEKTGSNIFWEKLLREQITMALKDQRKDANVQVAVIKQNACKQWLFYMEHGYLNWNAAAFDEKAMTGILETLATDYTLVQELRRLIRNNREAMIRIVRGHPESFLISLVEILTSNTQRDLSKAVNEIGLLLQIRNKHVATSTQISKQLQQHTWTRIMEALKDAGPGLNTGMLVKNVLLSEKDLPILTIELLQKLTTLTTIYPVLKVIQVKQQVREKQKQYEKQTGKKPNKENAIDHPIDQKVEIDEQGIFISNAGLVLIHPFLSTLFKKLGLVEGGKFINNHATEKAVHLLHFIATGKTTNEEHELVMAKILCALPIHYALKEIIELTEEEANETDNLLTAAVEQWEKLGNSSINALRENFLQRPGKLYTKNDMLYLQVENGSLDILLDFLPWTLSIVKLPWMKELLRIEWR